MSALVSIRLDDKLFQAMKAKARVSHLTQTDYIRQAIKLMNRKMEALEKEKKLKAASLRVRKESMKVNAEFSKIEQDPKA